MLFNCLMVYASSICHFGTVLMLTLGQLAHPHFCIRHHGSDRDIFSTLALHWFVFSSHCWEMVTWLVVWTPLKNMSSSVGMMTFPIYGKRTCSKPPRTWSHLPKPSSNQQFTSSLPRSSTGPPTAFAIQSGLQIRLWTAGMTTPSFSNVLSSAQPLRSYNASPGSQDPRIWIQLHFLSYGSKDKRKNVQYLPPQKKRVIFLEIIWDDDDGSPMEFALKNTVFFWAAREAQRGPASPALKGPWPTQFLGPMRYPEISRELASYSRKNRPVTSCHMFAMTEQVTLEPTSENNPFGHKMKNMSFETTKLNNKNNYWWHVLFRDCINLFWFGGKIPIRDPSLFNQSNFSQVSAWQKRCA